MFRITFMSYFQVITTTYLLRRGNVPTLGRLLKYPLFLCGGVLISIKTFVKVLQVPGDLELNYCKLGTLEFLGRRTFSDTVLIESLFVTP